MSKNKEGEDTVFFANCSVYEGERARLYRSPESIRRDIFDIKTKIESVDSMLNIRNIVTEMMSKCADGEPENWIPVLSGIVSDAEESLDKLKRLKRSLDILTEELEDTKWILGI